MAILTKEEIKEVRDITEELVPVPEWGGEVKVRSITQRQMNAIKNRAKSGADEINEDDINWNVFMEGVVEPQFDDDDREWVMDKSSSAYMRVIKKILVSSRMTDEAMKEEEKQFRTE